MTRTAAASPAVYREHPIKILRYSAKNLWLLIFPLLRSLRFYPFSFQNLIDWGAGVWFDLLVALFRRSDHPFPERHPAAACHGDPFGAHRLHCRGTPLLPTAAPGGVSAHQYGGRRNAGCGYAADAVSA